MDCASAVMVEATLSDVALRARVARLVVDLELGRVEELREVRALGGGVASDIARVALGDRALCVKFALPKLKVAADWHAPVHRSRAEYAWLSVAGAVTPGAAPRLHGYCEAEGGFAMEAIEGPGVYLWKAALLSGEPDRGEAARVGHALGRVHAASARPGFERAPFRNRDDFRALRIEPYLFHTAHRHPDLADRLRALACGLYGSETALVHGDVSPKNVLIRDGAPVLLDAECATMGDPAFDAAFCLNHLVLKAMHRPAAASSLLSQARRFWEAYAAFVHWEPPSAVEARAAALLPALMLARVDGKSPVEYLGEIERARARALARAALLAPEAPLAARLAALTGKGGA